MKVIIHKSWRSQYDDHIPSGNPSIKEAGILGRSALYFPLKDLECFLNRWRDLASHELLKRNNVNVAHITVTKLLRFTAMANKSNLVDQLRRLIGTMQTPLLFQSLSHDLCLGLIKSRQTKVNRHVNFKLVRRQNSCHEQFSHLIEDPSSTSSHKDFIQWRQLDINFVSWWGFLHINVSNNLR